MRSFDATDSERAHVKITANDSLPIDEGWPAQQSATDQ